MRNSFKFFFTLIFILIIGSILWRVGLVINANKNGKVVYEINVNNFNQVESYFTTSYERDKETGCIRFKDEFGIKRTVCNNYTITEY